MSDPDALGFLLDYLAAHAAGTALDGVPIRGGDLEPGDSPPALLLREGGSIRDRSVPFMFARIALHAFGPLGPAGPRIASELYRAASDLCHGQQVLLADGVGVWRMFEETGPQPAQDPITRWPETFGVIDMAMPDRTVS